MQKGELRERKAVVPWKGGSPFSEEEQERGEERAARQVPCEKSTPLKPIEWLIEGN